MNRPLILASIVIVLGGLGTWLLLPHRLGHVRPRRTRAFGTILAILALLLMASALTPPSGGLLDVFFYAFATAALSGGVLTITSRNPVHSALWFASVVLATSGLFLLAGAQFLAAGSIIVYAGAIIVTFLFVIMLAQSEGQAVYDRMARAPGAATLSGFGLLWAVFYALILVQTGNGAATDSPEARRFVPAARLLRQDTPGGKLGAGLIVPDSAPGRVLARALPPTATLGLDSPSAHVAGLGATLFTDHLIAVELGGALLFVALIGAISMATPRAPVRPPTWSAVAAGDVPQARNLAASSASI